MNEPNPSNVQLIEQVTAALEPFADIGQWLFARDLQDDTPKVATWQRLLRDASEHDQLQSESSLKGSSNNEQ